MCGRRTEKEEEGGFPGGCSRRRGPFGPQHQPKRPTKKGDSKTRSIVGGCPLPLQCLGWRGEEAGTPGHGQDHQVLLHPPALSHRHRALPGQPPPSPAASSCPEREDVFIAGASASVCISPPRWPGAGLGIPRAAPWAGGWMVTVTVSAEGGGTVWDVVGKAGKCGCQGELQRARSHKPTVLVGGQHPPIAYGVRDVGQMLLVPAGGVGRWC